MKLSQNLELTSEKYGNFSIEVISSKGKCVIWWDYLDEQDGFMLEPGEQIEAALNVYEDCDVRDFSDLPKLGEFKNTDEALKYLEGKFGEGIK